MSDINAIIIELQTKINELTLEIEALKTDNLEIKKRLYNHVHKLFLDKQTYSGSEIIPEE